MMADKNENMGELEGEPYGLIRFSVEGSGIVFETDCDLKTPLIGGLKEDFSEQLGVPSDRQIWVYNGRMLEDDRTLLDYGINGTNGLIVNEIGENVTEITVELATDAVIHA